MPHVFLHIPKTGGTTLGLVFRRRLQDRYFDDAREQRQGRPPFARLSAEEQARYSMVRGHFTFGYHERFKMDEPVDYLSMVRHPVQRVLSLYKHICRVESHHLHAAAKDMSLSEFVSSGVDETVDNGQVRALCGYSGPFGSVGRNHLEQALVNIHDRFPVVGVLEKFDLSLRLYAAALGWESVPKYQVRNEAPVSQRQTNSAEVLQAVAHENRYDMELFDAMKARLSGQARAWRTDQTLIR